jgi:hypothetical protein
MAMSRFLRSLALLLALAGTAAADEPKEVTDEQRAEHLALMQAVAKSIQLLADPPQANSKVKLVETPVLRYTDSTRKLHESSLWIWSNGGRPSATLAVEFYPKHRRGPRWLFEIASLSTERIAARREADLNWTAKEPGLKLQGVEGAQPPAEKAVRRLAQMKELSRRFTGHETATVGGRIELRPLSSPLFRYSDPDAHILDGAIFAFANGTNPEVLLVLEAHEPKAGERAWQFGLVQTTGAAVNFELDGKEVWQRDQADPPFSGDSYVNGWIFSSVNPGK